jgi:hypothetical protein
LLVDIKYRNLYYMPSIEIQAVWRKSRVIRRSHIMRSIKALLFAALLLLPASYSHAQRAPHEPPPLPPEEKPLPPRPTLPEPPPRPEPKPIEIPPR